MAIRSKVSAALLALSLMTAASRAETPPPERPRIGLALGGGGARGGAGPYWYVALPAAR